MQVGRQRVETGAGKRGKTKAEQEGWQRGEAESGAGRLAIGRGWKYSNQERLARAEAEKGSRSRMASKGVLLKYNLERIANRKDERGPGRLAKGRG